MVAIAGTTGISCPLDNVTDLKVTLYEHNPRQLDLAELRGVVTPNCRDAAKQSKEPLCTFTDAAKENRLYNLISNTTKAALAQEILDRYPKDPGPADPAKMILQADFMFIRSLELFSINAYFPMTKNPHQLPVCLFLLPRLVTPMNPGGLSAPRPACLYIQCAYGYDVHQGFNSKGMPSVECVPHEPGMSTPSCVNALPLFVFNACFPFFCRRKSGPVAPSSDFFLL